MKKFLSFTFIIFLALTASTQDYYEEARLSFSKGDLDSARFYINKKLVRKPAVEDYFLSALIHESEGKNLRALADYEAVIKKEPNNIEAYFQKGLIYYNMASSEQAIKDFTYVIDHYDGSETRAIYYGQDPLGTTGTFLTTLQSMIGRVYQYRGMAYQKKGDWEKALTDFSTAFDYDKNVDCYINRSQLYAKMDREEDAKADLKAAIQLDSGSYNAWYNLAILDNSTRLPQELIEDEEFTPMLNLMGANAYESGDFQTSVMYYSKVIDSNPKDDLAYLGRGKSLLRTGKYSNARRDFIKAMQLEPSRTEAFYLIGNSFFYEKKYQEAVGFYEQYLSIDAGYDHVWFNAAMAYLSLKDEKKGCEYLKRAGRLGMQRATEMTEKHCGK